jgi:hypothetical protein
VCYWALLFMPLVTLQYLYSLQIKGDSNKKIQFVPHRNHVTSPLQNESGLKPIYMELCYWALLFMPLVILHHLLNVYQHQHINIELLRQFYMHTHLLLHEARYITWYGDSLRTGDYGSIPGKGKQLLCSPLRLDRNWEATSFIYNCHQVLYPWGWSGSGVKLTTRLYLVPK